MTRFVKDRHPTIESSAPRDRVNLIAQGYRVEEFDPVARGVGEVLQYLATADATERDRVLTAERRGKQRKTVLEFSPPTAAPEEAAPASPVVVDAGTASS